MAFNDLLKQVGAVGRFQQIQVTLVILPMLLMASHNTLQNFTAAIPIHHCRLPPNASLGPDGKLGAWLPQDAQGRPESCLRFATPWREPRLTNDTTANLKEPTEPCVDGWVYDNSTFPSTIVTEVRLVLHQEYMHTHMPTERHPIQVHGHTHAHMHTGMGAAGLEKEPSDLGLGNQGVGDNNVT